MIETGHFPAWSGNKGERIASTLDIRNELTRVQPYSYQEYMLCYEAALDTERPISERERYLLARFGKEYADSPYQFNQRLDELEHRLAQNVGEFVLIQESPNFVFIERLESPNLNFISRVNNNGRTYGGMYIETSSSISTIIDDNFEIIPELTRDFVNIGPRAKIIAEGTTRHNVIGFDEFKNQYILDPEKPYDHEGDEYIICIGMDEILEWQRNNLRWAPHVDNMMEAWATGLINIPAAKIKQLSPIGESSLNLVRDNGPTQSLLENNSDA